MVLSLVYDAMQTATKNAGPVHGRWSLFKAPTRLLRHARETYNIARLGKSDAMTSHRLPSHLHAFPNTSIRPQRHRYLILGVSKTARVISTNQTFPIRPTSTAIHPHALSRTSPTEHVPSNALLPQQVNTSSSAILA